MENDSKLINLFLVGILSTALLFTSCKVPPPPIIGLEEGMQLKDCPNSPNCVSTFASDKQHGIEALRFKGEAVQAWAKLEALIPTIKSTEIVKNTGEYMHVTFTTNLMKFVDDVEFVLNAEEQRIEFRSASRVGYSDLGANRRRMEQIRKLWEE